MAANVPLVLHWLGTLEDQKMDRRKFMMSSVLAAVVGKALFISKGTALAEPLTMAARVDNTGNYELTYFDAIPGARSRDVAFDSSGHVWYCGQRDGTLTRLDPDSGELMAVSLGEGSAPHGVVLGPDNAMWITDGGQNGIARLDPTTNDVMVLPLPDTLRNANLNTGVFDHDGIYWFTGQNGVLGRVDPESRKLHAWAAEEPGPYGIDTAPDNSVWFVSLAGNYLGRIDKENLKEVRIDMPHANAGPRRVWHDSKGNLWISEWNSGHVTRFTPSSSEWKRWILPGEDPRCYSVYVDERDMVWTTDFSANAIVLFDPQTEEFTSFPSNEANANVRQMAGRPGEAWGGESGTDRLVRIKYATTA